MSLHYFWSRKTELVVFNVEKLSVSVKSFVSESKLF